jgi:anti-sigma B factor antagonist
MSARRIELVPCEPSANISLTGLNYDRVTGSPYNPDSSFFRGRTDMNISQRTVQGVCVLDIDGPITLGADGSEKLGDKVRSVLQSGEKQVLLNLSGVAYIDCAGLCVLVYAFSSVKKQGVALMLVGVTKKLKDLLVITKLSTVFDSYDTEAAALESYGA